MSLYCLTILYVYGLAVYYISCEGHASSVEYLIDRFVHPLDEWPVVPIVSCENRLKFMGSFQLVSGTAYCDRLPGECYPEVTARRLLAALERG